MIEVKLPVGCRPYQLYDAKKPTRRKPTPPQQRILDQMKPGIWYEAEHWGPDKKCKDRHESCRALVGEGWLQMGRIAKHGKDGELHDYEPEELLLEAIMGDKRDRQPFEMYRIANSPLCVTTHSNTREAARHVAREVVGEREGDGAQP